MPDRELSDKKGIDLAYTLLMHAVSNGSGEGSLEALTGQTTILFNKYLGIELTSQEKAAMVPYLEEMVTRVRESGALDHIQVMFHQARQGRGKALQDLGAKMGRGEALGVTDVAAIAFLGPVNLLEEAVRTFVGILDRMSKKLNFSLGRYNLTLRMSDQEVIVAGVVRAINKASEREKGHGRRIELGGRVMKHAARVSKRRDESKRASRAK